MPKQDKKKMTPSYRNRAKKKRNAQIKQQAKRLKEGEHVDLTAVVVSKGMLTRMKQSVLILEYKADSKDEFGDYGWKIKHEGEEFSVAETGYILTTVGDIKQMNAARKIPQSQKEPTPVFFTGNGAHEKFDDSSYVLICTVLHEELVFDAKEEVGDSDVTQWMKDNCQYISNNQIQKKGQSGTHHKQQGFAYAVGTRASRSKMDENQCSVGKFATKNEQLADTFEQVLSKQYEAVDKLWDKKIGGKILQDGALAPKAVVKLANATNKVMADKSFKNVEGTDTVVGLVHISTTTKVRHREFDVSSTLLVAPKQSALLGYDYFLEFELNKNMHLYVPMSKKPTQIYYNAALIRHRQVRRSDAGVVDDGEFDPKADTFLNTAHYTNRRWMQNAMCSVDRHLNN